LCFRSLIHRKFGFLGAASLTARRRLLDRLLADFDPLVDRQPDVVWVCPLVSSVEMAALPISGNVAKVKGLTP
jgi:hypothetical protein